MALTRRDFLGRLIYAPLALNAGLARSRAQTMPAQPPQLTNYNAGGRAVLTEGKTLLIALTFPSAVKSVQGGLPVQIENETAGGTPLTEPQSLFFYPAGDGRTFRTILSAPLDSVAGVYQLQVSTGTGAEAEWSFPYRVERGFYRQTSLTLDRNFSSPSPEIAARMRRDFETMVEIYRQQSPRRWHGPFVRPVPGGDRANFGDRRTVNGTKHYRHAGLDFHAPIGTPVRAVNDGVVVLSTEQWTPGQTVCIDHGGGVFSKYLHLSERRVAEGDTVKRSDVIALSGHSGGQKPAPHLHLDLVVNRVLVDPLDFMNTAARLSALDPGRTVAST